MNRRAFTLIEILIGLVLAGLVGGAVYKVLIESGRITRALNGRVDAQQSARTAALYLSTALREVAASEGDIIAASGTAIEFRAMRWTGITCTGLSQSGGNLLVTLRDSQLWGYRAPDNALDSLILYIENDVETRADDAWAYGSISDVETYADDNVTCPDAAPGTRLTFQINAASGGNAGALAGFTTGSPARGFQHEELSLYTGADTRQWLGFKTMNSAGTWTAVDALLGPLTAGGLALSYYDTLGVSTANVANIASIEVVIRAQALERTPAGYVADSVITRIAVRNNRRF